MSTHTPTTKGNAKKLESKEETVAKTEKKPRVKLWGLRSEFVDVAGNEMTIYARQRKGSAGFKSWISLKKADAEKALRGSTLEHAEQTDAAARFEQLTAKAAELGWTVVVKERKSRVKDMFEDVPNPVKKAFKK